MSRLNNTAIHDKVAASTLGVAVSQVVVYMIERFDSSPEPLPFAVAGALAVIFTFGAGYFVPESKPPTATE